ncbi:hypothetical protein N9L19_00095 [bacterium]|nr:hypothetical protein [bacterium]
MLIFIIVLIIIPIVIIIFIFIRTALRPFLNHMLIIIILLF